MRKIFIDFFLTFAPVFITIVLSDHTKVIYGIGIGLVLAIMATFLLYKLRTQRKKELIPEVLASGYYLNFITPLFVRLRSNANMIEEKSNNQIKVDFANVDVKIYKSSLSDLSKTKERVNEFNKYVIRDSVDDKGLGIRCSIQGTKIEVIDFPNTLFSMQDYFIKEFGKHERMKNSYLMRFYNHLQILINNDIQTGKTELTKLSFINNQ